MPKILKTHQIPTNTYPLNLIANIRDVLHMKMPEMDSAIIQKESNLDLICEIIPCYDKSDRLKAVEIVYAHNTLYRYAFVIQETYATESLTLFPCGGFYAPQKSLSEIEQLYKAHNRYDAFPKSIWLEQGFDQATFLEGTEDSLLLNIECGAIRYNNLKSIKAAKQCRDSRFLIITFGAA